MRIALILIFAVLSTGCTNVFLQPDKANYFANVDKFVVHEEGFIPASKGEKLHYWILPPQKNKVVMKESKGIVIQVHGNAQNLTSHVRSLGWLIENGYTLAIFDYRGYGQSSGKPDIGGAYNDVQTALDYITTELNPKKLPVFFYGQSLGGTLLLKAVSSSPGRWKPKLIVIESSFHTYTNIAREKLALHWVTWPFQWLAYPLVSNRYSLEKQELESISPVPVLLFYSENDPIVPYHNGQRIFKELKEPKELISYPERSHIAAMWVQNGRFKKTLLEALEKAAKN